MEDQPPFVEMPGELVQKLTGGLQITLSLWREFRFDELTVNQRTNDSGNNTWSEILSRARIGSRTKEDVKAIKSRLINLKNVDPFINFTNK